VISDDTSSGHSIIWPSNGLPIVLFSVKDVLIDVLQGPRPRGVARAGGPAAGAAPPYNIG